MAQQQISKPQIKATARQSGWGQIMGNNTASITTNVTFPTPFASLPSSVMAGSLGYKSNSAVAANIGEFNVAAGNMLAVQATNITTTGFTVRMQGTSAFGPAYHGFSWIAEA